MYTACVVMLFFFFSSRRRHTRLQGDWSSDVCSSDLPAAGGQGRQERNEEGTDARPWHNGEEREARVGPPTWAEFVESLDFRWLNCPSDTLGGGDDENELVNVKDGSMAVERFASRQPN